MGLGQEDSVKGVPMMKRQPLQREGVEHGYRQFLKPTVRYLGGELGGVCRELLQLNFNDDLPKRGGTDIDHRRGLDLVIDRFRKLWGLNHKPQKHMGIQQEIHSRPSNVPTRSGGNGASKSSAIVTRPFNNPGRRIGMGVSTGPSCATGVPSLQIVIRCPFATAARSLEKCVFAS